MSATLLNELNAFRAIDGKDAFKDWRKARHMPMLEAYRADPVVVKAMRIDGQIAGEDTFEASADELAAQQVRPSVVENDELVVIEEAGKDVGTPIPAPVATTEVAPKGKSYKEAAFYGKSTADKPVAFIHSFLDANPTLKRKDAVIALTQDHGINYSTARTQYQRWFTAQKAGK